MSKTDFQNGFALGMVSGGVVTDGGITPNDVLQALNDKTDNEPNKVYSANVINNEVVKPVTEHITALYENVVPSVDIEKTYENAKVYSANAINRDVILPVQEILTQAEYTSNKVNEIDTDYMSQYTDDNYPTVKAVVGLCEQVIEVHRREVNEQIEELQGGLDEISALVGGAE